MSLMRIPTSNRRVICSTPVMRTGNFSAICLWQYREKHTSYVFFSHDLIIWLWRLSFLRCRARDPLLGLHVLQPDHSGASWLEDVRWNEEPGHPKIRVGDDWGSPAQSDPWTGLCSVVDYFIASKEAERIEKPINKKINAFYPLFFFWPY